jgi:hypothetical protein
MATMAQAVEMLKDAQAHYTCLERFGYFDRNSGSRKVGDWFKTELARYQGMANIGNPDVIALVNTFYTGLNMSMLRNAYSDSYSQGGCLESLLQRSPLPVVEPKAAPWAGSSGNTGIYLAIGAGLVVAWLVFRKK